MAEKSAKRGYHHGNLRQALVEAALDLVVEKGPQGFTMAEAARRADVSPAAPYRHFKNQEDILSEAARQGFLIFADQLQLATDGAGPDPLKSFEAAGRAYLDFAQTHPGYYIAMFESSLSISKNPELALASEKAMTVLTDTAKDIVAHLPPEKRPPASMIAHHVWAMSHGIVELFARAEPGSRAPFSPQDLLESGTGIYLRGLGLIPSDD